MDNQNTGGHLKGIFITILLWGSNHLYNALVAGQAVIKMLSDYGAFFIVMATVFGIIRKAYKELKK